MSTNEEVTEAVRARVHKMSDQVVVHEGLLIMHGVKLETLSKEVEQIRNSSATKDQLDTLHRENGLRNQLLEAKVDAIKEDLRSIKGGISRLVWIVLTAVILAILTLVLSGPPHIGNNSNNNNNNTGGAGEKK